MKLRDVLTLVVAFCVGYVCGGDAEEKRFVIDRRFLERPGQALVLGEGFLKIAEKYPAGVWESDIELEETGMRMGGVRVDDGDVEEGSEREEDEAQGDVAYLKGPSPANCRALRPTSTCCDAWYIPDTLQHRQCTESIPTPQRPKSPTFANDLFNVFDEENMHQCLHASPALRFRCCHKLFPRSLVSTRACMATRENIVTSGQQICAGFKRNRQKRYRCCVNMLRGRVGLLKRCLQGFLPTFVNRVAPCVFRRGRDQAACCAAVSPRGSPSFQLCRSSVSGAYKTPLVCASRSLGIRKACCRDMKLFGRLPYMRCMKSKHLPCRMHKFATRLACCHARFKDKRHKKRRVVCMQQRFRRCQHGSWRRRIACCAGIYAIGTERLFRCVYQYYKQPTRNNVHARHARCAFVYPVGSFMYDDCISYAALSCQQLHRRNGNELESCCRRYFKQTAAGLAACMSHSRRQVSKFVHSTYTRFPSRHRFPVHTSRTSPTRFEHICRTIFPAFSLTSQTFWLSLACISSYYPPRNRLRLSAHPRPRFFKLTHVNKHEAAPQFRCAIMKETERAACCKMHFARTSEAYDLCMHWRDALSMKRAKMNRGRTGHEAYAHGTKQWAGLMKHAVMSATPRHARVEMDAEMGGSDGRVVVFARLMKRAEDAVHLNGSVPSDVRDVFEQWRSVVGRYVIAGKSATFFHSPTETWMACLRLAPSKGTWFCGRLSMYAASEIPQRKAEHGW